MPRLALIALLALPLAACDSGGPEDPGPTGPANASVSIVLNGVTARGQCDSSSNPGDFQFAVEVVDLDNNVIESFDLPLGATYGVWDPPTIVSLFADNQLPIDRTLSLQQPRAAGSGFVVVLNAMEWDSETVRDERLDDRRGQRQHIFRDGQFQSIVGTQELFVGRSDCGAVLDYDVTVQ